jgi:nicotinamide-nucleotide amidase
VKTDLAAELKTLLLRTPRWTVAVAESLTSGHLQAAIGATSGASAYFEGGLTAYSLEQKVSQLGVDRATAAAAQCVSAAVAEQMASGVARLFGTQWGVATTGFAEAAPSEGVPVPYAWWAVCDQVAGAPRCWSGRIDCPHLGRVTVQARVAHEALAQLVARVRIARQ